MDLSKDDFELTLKELRGQLVQVELQRIALLGSIAEYNRRLKNFG